MLANLFACQNDLTLNLNLMNVFKFGDKFEIQFILHAKISSGFERNYRPTTNN